MARHHPSETARCGLACHRSSSNAVAEGASLPSWTRRSVRVVTPARTEQVFPPNLLDRGFALSRPSSVRRTTTRGDPRLEGGFHAHRLNIVGVVAPCMVCHWRTRWSPAPLLQRVGRELCQGEHHCGHGPRGSSQLRRGKPKNRGLLSATTKQVKLCSPGYSERGRVRSIRLTHPAIPVVDHVKPKAPRGRH